jgi:putative membrane protein
LNALLDILPHVNASLNAIATVLLLIGFRQIKRGQERSHKWTMLACFGVSVLFLACYLTYHVLLHQLRGEPGRRFPEYPPPLVRYSYFGILITHIILAAAVPFLAIGSIYYGLKDNRPRHRWLSKLTFPIWLYVSVTGVIVYLMLYQIYPPREVIVP